MFRRVQRDTCRTGRGQDKHSGRVSRDDWNPGRGHGEGSDRQGFTRYEICGDLDGHMDDIPDPRVRRGTGEGLTQIKGESLSTFQ